MTLDCTETLQDPQATDEAAAALARALLDSPVGRLVVFLNGPVGAGKTSTVRALLRALGVTGAVRSPTYTLVEPYELSSIYLYHYDFYRFFDESEWEAAGFREVFDSDAVHLVEWPEKAASCLPAPDLTITLAYEGSGRLLNASASSEKGETVLTAWAHCLGWTCTKSAAT